MDDQKYRSGCGSSFFKEDVNHLIRLHFAREEATIDEALERLSKLKELLK